VSQRLIVPVLLISLATVSAFGTGDLMGLLPEGKEGFQADPEGPCLYLSSENLTEIYDGGYLTYVDRGVVSAASQAYASDSDFYQVVIHDMNSLENASVIVGYFYDLLSGGQATIEHLELGDGGFRYTQSGDFTYHYIYYHLSDLFVTLEGSDGAVSAMTLASEEIVTRAIPETIPVALLLICLAPWTGKDIRQ
jgi:hypothetical protein